MKRLAMLVLLALAQPLPAAAFDRQDAFDGQDRAEVIANAADLLERRYVYPEEGRKLAAALRQAGGQWEAIADPAQFARAVTGWLRQASKDGHLGLSYSETPLGPTDGDATFSAAEEEKWYGAHLNHGIEKIERLPGNVMLLDLRVFPPPSMAGDVLAAAMTVVAQGDALILDLRRNGGGNETIELLLGYLLDGGSQLTGSYDRPTDARKHISSPAWVPGRRFGSEKPLYVLTSRRTFSAAEAVAYDLQALGRATIVGEVTGGGAHPFAYRRVHDHFALDLPETRSINPITGSNWQGTGVKPDVEVPADKALEVAHALAREAVAKRAAVSAAAPAAAPVR